MLYTHRGRLARQKPSSLLSLHLQSPLPSRQHRLTPPTLYTRHFRPVRRDPIFPILFLFSCGFVDIPIFPCTDDLHERSMNLGGGWRAAVVVGREKKTLLIVSIHR